MMMRPVTKSGEAKRYFRDVVLAYQGNECLIWPYYRHPTGYGCLNQHDFVHRLVCKERHGPPPTPRHHAAHSCGQGKQGCVTKRHIDWKTPKENEADKLIHGTRNRGEFQGTAKLTESDVLEIRSLSGRLPQTAIAAKFGIAQTNVSAIQRRVTWGWL